MYLEQRIVQGVDIHQGMVLKMHPDCEVTNHLENRLETYVPMRERFIDLLLEDGGAYAAFSGLTDSGKSTIIGDFVQEVSRHPKIRQFREANGRTPPLYYISTATANLVIDVTDLIKIDRADFGAEEHRETAEVKGRIFYLRDEYLPEQAGDIDEGIMVTGFPHLKRNRLVTFQVDGRGDERGGVRIARNRLRRGRGVLGLVSAPEDFREENSQDRTLVRNTPVEQIPEIIDSLGIIDDRLRATDPEILGRAAAQVKYYYDRLIGTPATKEDADRVLLALLHRLIIKDMIPPSGIFNDKQASPGNFARHYREFPNQLTRLLELSHYPRWLSAMVEGTTSQAYLLKNNPLPPEEAPSKKAPSSEKDRKRKLHEFRVWQKRSDMLLALDAVAISERNGYLQRVLRSEFNIEEYKEKIDALY